MNHWFRFWVLGFLILLSSLVPGQGRPDLVVLESELAKYQKDEAFAYAQWGFSLRDVATGEEWVHYRGMEALIPASLAKLITCGTALDLLGPDTRLVTRLYYTGRIDPDGNLQGNIILQGGGDPSFGSSRYFGKGYPESILKKLADSIRAAGIQSVEGKILGDASFFPDNDPPSGWTWSDLGNYYAAPASALAFEDNLFRLYLQSGKTGSKVRVLKMDPPVPWIRLENRLLAGKPGSGDEAYIHGGPKGNLLVLKGSVPPNRSEFVIKGSVPDPTRYATWRLADYLEKTGIPVRGGYASVYRDTLPDRQLIGRWYSPPVRQLIAYTLQKSNNHFAETLLKLLGRKAGASASTVAGIGVIENWLNRYGIDTKSLRMKDGSGLSMGNQLSPSFLTEWLCRYYRQPQGKMFFDMLPVSGKTGTLWYITRGTPAEGKIHGKSGNLEGVRGYAGYVETVSGRLLAFCMIANHFTVPSRVIRSKWEKLMILMTKI